MRLCGCAGTLLAISIVATACSGEKRDGRAPAEADSATAMGVRGDSGTSGAGEKGVVLFLGTSLTAGLGLEPDSAYPQLLQRKIDARALSYQTINAGVSGETSAGLLRRLDWVLQHPAAVIVVETGANDGLRGQSVDTTRATIGQILTRIRRERPEAKLVLVQMEAPTNLGPPYTKAFHAMFPELAKEHGAVLMPFLLEGVAGKVALNQADGIHPNPAGARIVAENVWRTVEPLLSATGNRPSAVGKTPPGTARP